MSKVYSSQQLSKSFLRVSHHITALQTVTCFFRFSASRSKSSWGPSDLAVLQSSRKVTKSGGPGPSPLRFRDPKSSPLTGLKRYLLMGFWTKMLWDTPNMIHIRYLWVCLLWYMIIGFLCFNRVEEMVQQTWVCPKTGWTSETWQCLGRNKSN